jgi:hypothetical protein
MRAEVRLQMRSEARYADFNIFEKSSNKGNTKKVIIAASTALRSKEKSPLKEELILCVLP